MKSSGITSEKQISNRSSSNLIESITEDSPKLSSIPSTVSGLAVTSVPWLRLLLNAWNEADASLFGSNKDIHTDSEWTRTDFGLDSSSAWRNNLPTKLIPGTRKEKWTCWYLTRGRDMMHRVAPQVQWKGQTLGCIFLQQEVEGHIELLLKGFLQHLHVLQRIPVC